jgi:hypothetical protein
MHEAPEYDAISAEAASRLSRAITFINACAMA